MAREPKVLIFDLETSPLLAQVFGIRDQNIGLNQIQKDWRILTWAAKWLGKDRIYTGQAGKKKPYDCDKAIIKELCELIEEADVLSGHNIKRFDLKKLNARIIFHELPPLSKKIIDDTLVMARSNFGFTSNKLEYLADYLGVGHKMTDRKFNGHSLWMEYLRGNPEAMREMIKYNAQDVIVTEGCYLKMRPHCKTFDPNLFKDENEPIICVCGSENLHGNGMRTTTTGTFHRLRCADCGKHYKQKKNFISPQRRRLLNSQD